MDVVAWIIAAIAVLMLVGQFFAGMADYYLAIRNPRPLDDNHVEITSTFWGFLTQSKSSVVADLAGQGFADVRVFATRRQMLVSIITFGARRPLTIAWRGNAGQHRVGDA